MLPVSNYRYNIVQAWCDASFNFGLTIGPVIGAFMYDAGGFFLPFAVTGTAILLSGCLVLFITDVSTLKHQSKPTLVILLRCPILFITNSEQYHLRYLI